MARTLRDGPAEEESRKALATSQVLVMIFE